MSAGTVISGGFPGRVAQEVQPNQKCEGCLHYDRQVGRTGACTIGDSPWKCGDGDAPDIGYAPLVRGAGSYLPDMSNHGVHASEVDPQHVGGLYGAGSTRPVEIRQVSLGEEHVHFVKSFLERHGELQKSQCLRCSMRGTHGTGPANTDPQTCSCKPVSADVVAKAVVARLSNADRARTPLDAVAQWVRDVAKAGFRLPAPKTTRGAADTLADVLGKMGVQVGGRSDDRSGGHLQPSPPIEKGERVSFRSEDDMPHVANPRSWVSHARTSHGTYQLEEPGARTGEHARVTYRAHDGSGHVTTHASANEATRFARQHHAKKTGKPEQGPQASATYAHHFEAAGVKKSFYSEDWITQFKGTPLFDAARKLCERELEMEEAELARRAENLKHEKAREKVLKQVQGQAAKPNYDWQEQEADRTKIRIAKQRLALKLAGLHQEKLAGVLKSATKAK